MTVFSLEALRAKGGDCFLLHFGDPVHPKLILIDGGPSITFRTSLAPRLDQIRKERGLACLDIELTVVAHADSLHMGGIIRLLEELLESKEDGRPPRFNIRELWHNSLADLFGPSAGTLLESAAAEVGDAAIGLEVPSAGLSRAASTVLASAGEAKHLTHLSTRLGLQVNREAPALTSDVGPIQLAQGGLQITVLAPAEKTKRELTESLDRELERLSTGEDVVGGAAAYVDTSVYRLASLVLFAESAGRTMLLTGDAREDDIVEGLARANLLDGGRIHVDLLKLPGHGSCRNVSQYFFQTVTADHYVVSADGRHGNPDVEVFEMIRAARQEDAFTIWLTYPPERFVTSHSAHDLRRVLDPITVRSIRDDELSAMIDLADPLY